MREFCVCPPSSSTAVQVAPLSAERYVVEPISGRCSITLPSAESTTMPFGPLSVVFTLSHVLPMSSLRYITL